MNKVKQMLENLEKELRANKQYSAADKLLPIIEEAEKDRLIPCSERLPEDTGRYLLQCKQKVTNETYFKVACINVWSEICKTWIVDGIPVAWMPLPEPYKGE